MCGYKTAPVHSAVLICGGGDPSCVVVIQLLYIVLGYSMIVY